MRRRGIVIMGKLIGLVKPLVHVMFITITMGVLGYLASIFITIYGGIGVVKLMGFKIEMSIKNIFSIVAVLAVARGFLRYIEQFTGHYIAFKLLAILRDRVFKKLRELSPAKLEGEQKGNLISIITSDIELLEVFYAHTIAPISIAIITSIFMTVYIGKIHVYLGIMSAFGYITIGFIIPYFSSKLGNKAGLNYRNSVGNMNSFMLDSLKGMREIIMFNLGEKRIQNIDDKGRELNKQLNIIKKHEGIIRAFTDSTILIYISIILFVGMYLYKLGLVNFQGVIISTISIMSSFGPVVALSNLSNNLVQTLASGDRVLNLLEENPIVKEVNIGEKVKFENIEASNVTFSYDDKDNILDNVNIKINKGEIIGIVGDSGCGKSTLLKLFMRFWDVKKGSIKISNRNIKNINTNSLRNIESFVTQETFLFNDTIEENIKLGKKDATIEEVKVAAKKASIHKFIESLPNGYKTKVGELGENLSGGERQRLGIARAFLHDGDIILLDEPTSNIDSLNEKVIIKTIKEQCSNKTVIIVSHRISTVSIADKVYSMYNRQIVDRELIS
ncbi:ABC transporter ATP-binding protein [Clostridium botulinum]|nr:ABC transporter ATP-binding protein [Clostridium botulinum D str. CCUG 7971]KOC51029.1 ABC transporter ATP-binding protein [Clostridium botulinum]OOV51253.1 ABC transporter ATP-binding protein [Clostridium botulinum D/C]NFO96919.1 ABC transporter ATP-binding protein [Clostridium botulinum]OOV57391.1 ABC transporter ATP-binding protein [Clostridium botulinum D/C]